VETISKFFTFKRVIIIVIVLFLILNAIWYIFTTQRYSPFTDAVPLNDMGIHYIEKEGYSYSVKKPDYLYYTGNLAVNHPDRESSLIIWPEVNGKYTLGFRLQENEEAFEIYLDEKLTPLEEYEDTDVASQKVKEHQKEINDLFSKADQMWNIK
jgi:hypothetical protein